MLTVVLMAPNAVFAYDFSAAAPTGQTLYYNINGNSVTLTCPYETEDYQGWDNLPTPSGILSIPASVNHNGQTYSVTKIGDYAFDCCSTLTSVTIPNTVTAIGASAFNFCYALTSISIPNSITNIGNAAFYSCTSLTSIVLPNSLTRLGGASFELCTALTSVTLSDGITTINPGTFSGCSSLQSLTIPNTVTVIGSGAFENCSALTSITLPDSITKIKSEAFKSCTGLTSLTLGRSLTNIYDDAFNGCRNIANITIYAVNPPTLGNNVFNGVPSNINVNVPCGKQLLYYARWTHFSNFIEMCNSGIDDVNALSANVYSVQGRIVVESGNGGPLGEVRVCDMMGRSLATGGVSAEGTHRYSFDVPATGTYFVKIGNLPARKVVVIR